MKKTAFYLIATISWSAIFCTAGWAQTQVTTQGRQDNGQTLMQAKALQLQQLTEGKKSKREEIDDIRDQIASLEAQLQNTQDPQQRAQLQDQMRVLQNKLQQAEKELLELQEKTERVQREIQALQAQQQSTSSAPSLSNYGAVSGNSVVYRNPKSQIRDQYQLIPVKTTTAAREVKSYLDDLLSGGFDDSFGYSATTTAWLFVSSADENIIYNAPYLKEGNVWFDVVSKNMADKQHLSLWLFHMPAGQDFGVRFNGTDKSAEMSAATLLNERFKKGNKKEQTAGAFRINSFGEYFEDRIVFYSGQDETGQRAFGNISYLSTISAKIGTMFGFEYTPLNKMTRSYNFKCIHPPYKSGPEQGTTEFMIAKQCTYNKKDNFIWKFTEHYELVPGSWQLQILDGGVVIYQKKFTITIQPVMQTRSLSGIQNNSTVPVQAGQATPGPTTSNSAVPVPVHAVQAGQAATRPTPSSSVGTVVKAAVAKPLTLALTEEQSKQVRQTKGGEATITLTELQFVAIRKKFPKLAKKSMKISISGGNFAAPFVPGGSVLSAAITGVSGIGEAVATVSGDDSDD